MINLWARVWKTTTMATTTTVGDCNDGKNLINSLHTHRFNQQTSRAEAAEAGERNEKLPSRLTFWHRRRVTAECGVGVAAGGKNCQSSPRLSANLKRPLTAISGCHVCLSRTHTGKSYATYTWQVACRYFSPFWPTRRKHFTFEPSVQRGESNNVRAAGTSTHDWFTITSTTRAESSRLNVLSHARLRHCDYNGLINGGVYAISN